MISVTAGTKALVKGMHTYVYAQDGTDPITYAVLPGGVGGSVNSSSGLYTAPNSSGLDRVQATDADGNKANLTIMVGSPLDLVCDIIRNEMTLKADQVFLWDQKINVPNDSRLYVAVSIVSCKPFAISNQLNEDGEAEQSVNMQALVSFDIMSRSLDALERKEEIILALSSLYSQQQQEVNSFFIGRVSSGFVNLSEIDGAAIPYRFNISVQIQYSVAKTKAVPYYDTFDDENPSVVTEP